MRDIFHVAGFKDAIFLLNLLHNAVVLSFTKGCILFRLHVVCTSDSVRSLQ